MSSMKFPKIARQNESVTGGWEGYVNKNGREGSDLVIREAFTVKLNGEGATDDGGPEREAGPELGDRPDGG
jgi:hypothetical protein